MNTKILLVDDYEIVREGMRLMLQREPGFEVVGCVEDGAEALRQTRALEPDLVLIDMNLGETDGVEVSRQIMAARPDTCILMMSGAVDFDMVNDGIEAGVKGFLLKTNAVEELVRAIRAVINGGSYLCQEMAQVVVTRCKGFLTQGMTPNKQLLTPREREVLKLTADGLRMKDIANRLNIGVKTVETHRSHLMKKLTCGSSAELTRYAIREGISPI